MPDERHRILDLLRIQEAATARGDATGVAAAIAADGVVYALPPPLESRGRATRDTAALEKWFATWEDGVTVALADPTIMIEGDLAVVYGLSRLRGTKKGQGPIDTLNGRTAVLRQQD